MCRTIQTLLSLLLLPAMSILMADQPHAIRQEHPAISTEQVVAFANLALQGIPTEFPNKPSNTMASATDVLAPRQMHPAFFGCFDWHSSVHGHWMLARLLRLYPDSPVAAKIRQTLNRQLTAEKMESEAEYFRQDHNKSFERMYGWAWTMKLIAELHTWDDPDATTWRNALRPLEEIIVQRATDYLPLLSFPIRTGVHPDTGFALALTLDYARSVNNADLEQLVIAKSRQFYLHDENYPAHYEPSGHDFFSSGFNEADLMRRVLSAEEFSSWLDRFLPQLKANRMGPMMKPVEVPDVTDGHLVHLAGLDLSRAWTMNGIASVLPDGDPRRKSLRDAVAAHKVAGLQYVSSGNYEGEHWLATFAVYHLTNAGF
jgi:Protein of unknown function (DUF2891)